MYISSHFQLCFEIGFRQVIREMINPSLFLYGLYLSKTPLLFLMYKPIVIVNVDLVAISWILC